MSINWKETPKAKVFQADLPGLKKEELKVKVEEGNMLQISGERSKEKEEENEKWHVVERSSGKFIRRFRLPDNANMDQMKASWENGVLTITVPMEEAKKPEVKTIKIDGIFLSTHGRIHSIGESLRAIWYLFKSAKAIDAQSNRDDTQCNFNIRFWEEFMQEG